MRSSYEAYCGAIKCVICDIHNETVEQQQLGDINEVLETLRACTTTENYGLKGGFRKTNPTTSSSEYSLATTNYLPLPTALFGLSIHKQQQQEQLEAVVQVTALVYTSV